MFVSSRAALFLTVFLSLFFVNTNALSAQITNEPGGTNIYELPAGTRIAVQMDNEINSKSFSANDTFTVEVIEPIVIRGVSLLSAGAIIEGRIANVNAAAGGGKGGNLEVAFETLRIDGERDRQIEARLVNPVIAKSSRAKSVLAVLGSVAAGAVIGGAAKGTTGALIGSGVGAGIGGGSTLFIKGNEVRIKAGEKFEIELIKKVTMPAKGF